jgi:hypothetical protein
MRTTLALDDDAMQAVASFAQRLDISPGKAASELIRRGSAIQLGIRQINGLPVFEVPCHFPKISTAQVLQLLDGE